jgi:hypothetical protein
MNKILAGLGLGFVAGILDVIPMLFMGLPWDANLSAFCLWVVSGVFVATVDWKVRPPTKGILVPFLVLLPSAILIGAKEPINLVPTTAMILLLGAPLGWSVLKAAPRGRAG